jgi:integrase
VYLEHGRYWYRPKRPENPPEGWKQRIDLGITVPEMYDALKKIARAEEAPQTMEQVFDKYLLEVLPGLALRTQSDYRTYIMRMRPVLANWLPREVTATDIFDIRAALAKESGSVQANRHISCLSAVLREAVGWHCGVEANPCHELRRLSEAPRTRYVFDSEFTAVYAIASPMMQVAMDLATITGQREDDLLKLPARDPHVYTEEGIVFRPGKTKRRHPRHGKIIESSKIVIVRWSPELTEVVERARELGPMPPVNIVPIRPRSTLICTQDGQPYTGSGFRANWSRLMRAALHGRKLKNGVVTLAPVLTESFTFNDLRAKNATDEEDFEEAHNRLAHSDRKTTQQVYVRKPRKARAGRKVGA